MLFFYGDFLFFLAPFWDPFGGEISLFYINAALGIPVPGVPVQEAAASLKMPKNGGEAPLLMSISDLYCWEEASNCYTHRICLIFQCQDVKILDTHKKDCVPESLGYTSFKKIM